MALSNLTKVQTVGIGSNIEVVGVITTGQFKSGTSNLHSTGVELTNLNVSGIATIGGNVTIGGTLTYQDVTNIDSVGVITARSAIDCNGDLDVDGHTELDNVRISGITTVSGEIRKPVGTYHPMLTIRNQSGGSVAMRIDNWSNNASEKRINISHNFHRISSAFAADDSSIGCASIAFEDGEIRFGTSAAGTNNSQTRYKFNSSGHFIPNADSTFDIGTNSVRVRNFYADTLYGDGSNLTGVTQVGGASSVTFNDSVAANFGTDNDLVIYHNGTHAVISNTTGNLHIKDNSIKLQDESANPMITATSGGSVDLYHNASLKFSTTGHGIVVEDDNPYIVIQDSDTASGNGVVGWIEAQNSNGGTMWKIGNTHNDQNTLWINQRQNASTKFTGAISGDTWEIYGNSGHFAPCNDNTVDIGSSSKRVRNIYTADLHCSNRGSSNDVDGTWGDYTIQEGESDLFLINNRSGKKFKFNLTEVN